MSAAAVGSKTALITGAGREPASLVALALARLGWQLALNDLTPLRLEEVARAASGLGAQVSTHVGDASKGLFARGLVEETLDRWGHIDLLVNCPLAAPRQALLDLDEWDFQRTLEANIHGPFLLMQLAGNWWRNEGRQGLILNLVSAAPTPPDRAGQEAAYASQVGLRALTAASAPGLKEHNIRVYALCSAENDRAGLARRVEELLDPQQAAPTGTIFQIA